MLLASLILLLKSAELLSHLLNTSLYFIALSFKTLRTMDKEDGETSHAIGLVHQIEDATEADDGRQCEAKEGLTVL